MATGSKEIHPQDEDAATGKSTVQIRQVRAADLEACARIEQVCYHGHGASWERIALRIRDYPQGFRVALLDGQVAGFINSGSITGEDIADDRLKELDGHDPAGRHGWCSRWRSIRNTRDRASGGACWRASSPTRESRAGGLSC